MTTLQNNRNKSFDWVMLTVYFSLVAIGWAMLYSSTYISEQPFAFMDISTTIGSQTVWVIISLLAFFSVLTLDWKFWNTLSIPLYAVSLLLLILVLIVGKEINGSKSWFYFGVFSFQPSEWAKLGTALALSGYLSFLKINLSDRKTLITAVAIILIPALFILLQPDMGSALVFFSFFILLYRKGLSPVYFIVIFSFAAAFALSLIFSPMNVSATILTVASCILIFYYFNSTQGLVLGAILAGLQIFLIIQDDNWIIMVPSLAALVETRSEKPSRVN